VFIGHFAVGFAAKRVAPRTSVATLIVAAIFLDLLWPVFVRLGLRNLLVILGHPGFTRLDARPYSHSLFMALVWSVVLALAYRARTRYRAGAVAVGLAVLSHWFLDFISHDPDLPLAPWLPIRVGIPLGGSFAGIVAVECAFFSAGLAVYLRTTRAKGWAGHVSLWSVLALLVLAYFMDLFRLPLPVVEALHSVFLVVPALLLLLWFVWVDRTRTLRTAPRAPTGA
jgi:hypothetical protein